MTDHILSFNRVLGPEFLNFWISKFLNFWNYYLIQLYGNSLNIVTFSDTAKVAMPWTCMDTAGQTRAQQIVSNLYANGGENGPGTNKTTHDISFNGPYINHG